MQKEKEFDILREKLNDSNNFNEFDKSKVWDSIESKLITKNKIKGIPYKSLRVAAIILLIIGSNLIYKYINTNIVSDNAKPLSSKIKNNNIENETVERVNVKISNGMILTKNHTKENKDLENSLNNQSDEPLKESSALIEKTINNELIIKKINDSASVISQNQKPIYLKNKLRLIHYSDLGNSDDLKYLVSKEEVSYQNLAIFDNDVENKNIMVFKIKNQ
jgi:cell division protein FtsI/penicillin-binding protein 2